MNVLGLAEKRVRLKKVSATYGGEWQGPCPSCGGTNRFHVWPEQHEGKGSYWCRGCDKVGDNIQFLIDFEGMTFKEACRHLNVSLLDRPTSCALQDGPRAIISISQVRFRDAESGIVLDQDIKEGSEPFQNPSSPSDASGFVARREFQL